MILRPKTLEEMEKEAIIAAIRRSEGNLTTAAKELGVGRAFLYRKVKQYQIDPAIGRKKPIKADPE